MTGRRTLATAIVVLAAALAGASTGLAAGSSKLHLHGTRDGRALPAPLPDPGGSSSTAAQALATTVLAGGNRGVAALETALRRGGFGIVNLDGSQVRVGDLPASGVNVEAGELFPIVQQGGRQYFSLDSLLSVVATALGNRSAAIAQGRAAVLSDLKAAAHSNVRTLSFLAHFVDDLQPGSSILSAGGAADFHLNGLQLYLLTYQVAEGARILEGAAGSSDLPVARRAEAGSEGPCQVNENHELRFEAATSAVATASEHLREWIMEEHGNGLLAEGALGAANAALALERLLSENSALKVDIELQGGEPLERTKDQQAGTNRVISAKVSLDVEKPGTQYTNCLKAIGSVGGLEIASPTNEVNGAGVTWFVQDQPGAGGSGVTANPVQIYGQPITRTNAEGEAHTGLQGTPQRVKFPDKPAPYPWMRRATVGVMLSLHVNDLGKDWPELVGAGLTGGAISGVKQTLEHMNLFTYTKSIQVKDWADDYELDFDSTMVDAPLDATGQWNYEVVAHVPIAPVPEFNQLGGSAPEAYKTANGSVCGGSPPACTTLVSAHPDNLFATELTQSGGSWHVMLDPNNPTETYHTAAGSLTMPFWLEFWTDCNETQSRSGFSFPSLPGNDIVGKGVFSGCLPGSGITQSTELILHETPPTASGG